MLVDPKRSKFGVYFGDNVYYAAACSELAEMLARTGDAAAAGREAKSGTVTLTRRSPMWRRVRVVPSIPPPGICHWDGRPGRTGTAPRPPVVSPALAGTLSPRMRIAAR